MKYNLHTHTARCHHAEGSDREYVEAAIQAGIKILGFADHCPQFFPTPDYYSFFRMRPETAQEYVASVRALQKEYASDIQILVGFETEYYPELFEKLYTFIQPLQLDYLILGQHFVGNEYDKEKYYSGSDEALLSQFVLQVKEAIDTGCFTYVAHPDNIGYRGSQSFYNSKMRELCEHAKLRQIPLEYNMLGYKNARSYPTPQFWDIAASVGNQTVIGYDAHKPSDLLTDDAYDHCLHELTRRGLQPLAFDALQIKKP